MSKLWNIIHLAVDIDANTLAEDLRKLLPGAAPPARALARAIVFSNILVPYIGVAMTQQLQTKSLEGFGAPPQDESLELAKTRAELARVLGARRKHDLDLRTTTEEAQELPPKRRRSTEAKEESIPQAGRGAEVGTPGEPVSRTLASWSPLGRQTE